MERTLLCVKHLVVSIPKTLFFCSSLLILHTSYSQIKSAQSNWSVRNPFEHKVFIENKGQFNGRDIPGTDWTPSAQSEIRYGVNNQGMEIYFSTHGLTYRHDAPKKISEREREKQEEYVRKHQSIPAATGPGFLSDVLNMDWLNANPNPQILVQDQVSEYFTYGDGTDKSGHTGIKANAYRKIIYKNLYPNIDVEYTFPVDKEGIKYSLVLHPGADLAVVQMSYSLPEKISVNKMGCVQIKTPFGTISDQPPITFYENGQFIKSSYRLVNNIVSFAIDETYDASRTIIVDPWTKVPTFLGQVAAYDLCYDQQGNVYVYGSFGPWEEAKYSSTGTLLWTYQAGAIGALPNGKNYGDFAVDPFSGSSYICEAFNPTTGSRIIKLNSAGTQLTIFGGDLKISEMWRAAYNSCTRQLVVGSGGVTSAYQAAVVDTTMTSLLAGNPLNTTELTHDIALLALDNTGSCFMEVAKSDLLAPTTFVNILIKSPANTLASTAYQISTNYNFTEIPGLATYIAGGPFYGQGVGFNGMAVSNKYVYTYDGSIVKRWDKNTGALLKSSTLSGTTGGWGGLEVDECENVYVGLQSSVIKCDFNFNTLSTIATANNVYDLKLGPGNKLLVCGEQFVSSFQLAAPICTTTKVDTIIGSCIKPASATVTVTGPNSPYSYSWSSGQTTQTITGIPSGKYIVTIMDNQCPPKMWKDSAIVTNNTNFTVTSTHTDSKCFGAKNGTATLTVTGSTSPFTYSWNTTPIQNVANAVGLDATSYTCTIVDTKGCSQTTTIAITQPTALTATVTGTPALCNGAASGTATVNVTGGISGYTYSWSNSQTLQTATGLTSGLYAVVVSDANACSANFTASITEPSKLYSQSIVSPAKCFGACSGQASVTSLGGNAPYSYSWNVGGTGATANNLCKGSYTVTMSDKNSCTHDTILQISEPLPFSHTDNASPAACGKPDGSAAVIYSGGTGNYTYAWSNGSTNATLSNVKTGVYTVTINDSNGCTESTTVKVPGGGSFTATPTLTDVACFGGTTGTATISATSGSPPYTYSWSNGQTTATVNGLSAGTYTCIINDQSPMCADTVIIVLTQPNELKLQATSTNVSCNALCDGKINILPSGSVSPYAFTWSSVGSGSASSSLCAGSYSITVNDKNLCAHDTIIQITEPPALAFNKNITPSICNGANGGASVTASGGIAPYSYSWNTGTGASSLTGIISGIYSVTVTDGNGCNGILQFNVPNASPFSVSSSSASVHCYGDETASLTVNPVGSAGPYTYSWSTGEITSTINNLGAGIYTATVTDPNGCVGIVYDTISEPSQIKTNTSTQTICEGQSATLGASASGGVSPYTYVWNNLNTGISLTDNPVKTTTYTVETTDGNGCKTMNVDTIIVNALPQSAFSAIDVCLGVHTTFRDSSYISSGSVSNWQWFFGDGGTSNQQNPTHLYTQPGTFTARLTVANGPCQTTMTRNITVHTPPKADYTVNPETATISDPYIRFTDLSLGGTSGKWYFGDNADTIYSPGNNIAHLYSSDNKIGGETYITKLIISNQYGCKDSVSKPVHINPEWAFYIPDAFSPNGDGLNDFFYGTGFGILEKEMWVFDRWGMQIFHTTDLNGQWDGKVQGGARDEFVQQDVYVWVVRLKEVFGTTHKYTGHVSVVR